ncbi:ABC transporter permease [Candidatus Pacearchaeota archaeon]|nr:ABC transporter permease [Candidatus Pacearchaeota archaeon]
MITDYFILAIRNIRKRKLRSWLTILGIIISIATIFMLISISLGLQGAVEEQFRLLGTDKFFIQPRGQIAGPGTESAASLSLSDVNAIEKVPGVKDLSYFVAHNVEVVFSDQKRFTLAIGFPFDKSKVFDEIESYKAEDGSILKKGDEGKVMIGSHYKHNNIFKRPVRVGDNLEINKKKFKIKGILEPIGNPSDDRMIYMSIKDFLILFPEKENVVDQIIVQIDEGEDINEVIKKVDKKLRDERKVDRNNKDFIILSPEELLASFGSILNIITAFLFGVAAISLLVGGIGIANTLFTSVLERTREIGTMKAVGARNRDILLIFLIESGLIGAVGGIVGVLLGAGISKSIEIIAIKQLGTTLLQAAFPFSLIAGCIIFAFLAGSISGIWPAYRASKLRAVDALRYE